MNQKKRILRQGLRKLESLKQDGLITEDEYRKKRKEIMEEKW